VLGVSRRLAAVRDGLQQQVRLERLAQVQVEARGQRPASAA
jgi:hypothetical protein